MLFLPQNSVPKMGVEKGKMARNSEEAVARCQLPDRAAVGKAVQGSQVEMKVPITCSHGRQAPALVAEEQHGRCSMGPTWTRRPTIQGEEGMLVTPRSTKLTCTRYAMGEESGPLVAVNTRNAGKRA
jgi:hypothetical protein